ncbi:MAG: hypothetical protein NUW01_01620 [Gemmatimonadaceae bacterium]|nr:hypothetical protein [Gemmatimonadaceae bacterium]
MGTAAIERTTPIETTPPFPGLVVEVKNWQTIQKTRIRVETPIKGYLRNIGVIEKDAKPALDELLALSIQNGAPLWMVDQLHLMKSAEKEAAKRIQAQWKHHPLAPWVETVPGVGPHSCAVVVGMLNGDPAVAYPIRREGPRGASRWIMEEPFERTLAQLWQYCGYGDPTVRRYAGMPQDAALRLGNPLLKSQLHLMAEDAVKCNGAPDKNGRERPLSPYRAVYDARRAETADRLHERSCSRCGPSGHPAQPGSPWSKKHQMFDAHRILLKYGFLKDLRLASRRLQHGMAGAGDDE